MNSSIKVMPNIKKFNSFIEDIKKDISPIMLSGLTDVGKAQFVSATNFYTEKPICLVTYNELQAKKLVKDIEFFTDKVAFFPKKEMLIYDYVAESKEIYLNRINVLNKIQKKEIDIIVTTIEAASQKMISRKNLYKNILKFKLGDIYNLDNIKEKLVELGYERYDQIEGIGQFSIRGGLIDISLTEKIGIRIEFWGDEIDSIRNFDIMSQRSTDNIKEIDIFPAYELLLEDSIENVIEKIKNKNIDKIEKVQEDIDSIENGEYITKIDKYFDCFYEKQETILDYLENSMIFLDEVIKIKSRLENIKNDIEKIVETLVEKEKLIPNSLINMFDYIDFMKKVDNKQIVYLEKQDIGFVDKKSMHAKRNGYSFSYREVNFFRSTMDLCIEEIQKSVNNKKTVIIATGNKENLEKISSMLFDKEIANTRENKLDESCRVVLVDKSISEGTEAYDFNLLILNLEHLFTSNKKRKKVSNTFKEGTNIVFNDLTVGDFIVHKNYGIGQFVGVNTIKADKVIKDYLKITYKNDDVLYVPTDALDSIRKYIGVGKEVPNLSKLGGKEWENTKNRVKNNLKEVAKDLIDLYATRQTLKGYEFSKDTVWQKEFEDSFEYIETDDQLRCIEETKKDMENIRPMDRLLCGDVGYGKTEVAIRAAFKAVVDKKQVAYLVPTTILAKQQYESFKERMEGFAIKVELLNRFKTKKEQKEILENLKNGKVDIVVGTHRLLSEDVIFNDLGLLIIDEEHRFGVKDKEKIKKIKTNIDVLTMTATPIPRTLHLSIVGIRDMSVIYEPPQNRIPVQTYVLEYDEEMIREAITKEIERNGQVFYLYNKVEGIEKIVSKIEELVPEAKVAFAHGKMSGRQLENIMMDFVKKDINVLVCTTILESGIDIPNANTIIVENADRLGLAQLYQIRGRVGRSDKQAYAYITYKRDKIISEIADKRLKTIKEFTDFGAGFKIAMRDLEIRGAGSILGEYQHGQMDVVGYDMYCKMLDEAVKEIQGVDIEEELDVQIDLNISSFISDEYISENSQKIEIYQKIALCKNENDIIDITDEIIDRYGKTTKEIDNLLEICRVKNLAKLVGITKISQKEENIIFYFDNKKFNLNNLDKLVQKYSTRLKFSSAYNSYITLKLLNKKNIIKEIKEFLNDNIK